MIEGITYRLGDDGLYYPNLGTEEVTYTPTKWGKEREEFLKEEYPNQYSLMQMRECVNEHLMAIDEQVTAFIATELPLIEAELGLTDELKTKYPNKWERVNKEVESELYVRVWNNILIAPPPHIEPMNPRKELTPEDVF